jgi:hypothetical protein
MITVYKISVPDGRGYIGVSGVPQKRFSAHFNSRTPLGEAMRAAGRDAVRFEIIKTGDRARMCQLEKDLIVLEGTKKPDGFNSGDGGEGLVRAAGDARNSPLAARVRPAVKAMAEAMAADDRRSLAQWLELMIEAEAERRRTRAASGSAKA